jgi:hypothetical protein
LHWNGPYVQIPWGGFAGSQALLRDTNLSRTGVPISPAQPDGEAWWEEVANHSGFQADPIEGNQAVWLAFAHDVSFDADDTLGFWTVLTTVRDGVESDLRAQIYAASMFTSMKLGLWYYACCAGRVGDANGLGMPPNEVTISDIQLLVTAKFISSLPCGRYLNCLDEADVNHSGGADPMCSDITITDIAILVDHLFVSGPEKAPLQPCVW